MGKNEIAWTKFIRDSDILGHIYSPGYVYISADDLKTITLREPWLLAKQDTLK